MLVELAYFLLVLGDGFHHVDGDADGARLVGQSTGNRLTNPPRGVSREFVAFGVVEFVYRLEKAEIPFLNEVEEREVRATIDVFLGDRDDEAEVGASEDIARFIVFLEDALREVFLLLTIEEWVLADFAQIHLHGIIARIRATILQFLARQDGISRAVFKHAAAFQDINARDGETIVDFFEQRDIVFNRRELAENFVVGDVSALLTHQDKCLNFILSLVARTFLGRRRSRSRFLVSSFRSLCAPFDCACFLSSDSFLGTRSSPLAHRAFCLFCYFSLL